jgi:hypothetical protein
MLADAPYEELLATLTAVRGLGQWTVEMFACFALKRMDVFSTGDLGVQRGMAAFVGRDVRRLKGGKGGKWKYMGEEEMVEVAGRFRPYRSLFMWYVLFSFLGRGRVGGGGGWEVVFMPALILPYYPFFFLPFFLGVSWGCFRDRGFAPGLLSLLLLPCRHIPSRTTRLTLFAGICGAWKRPM